MGLSSTGFNSKKYDFVDPTKTASSHKYGSQTMQKTHPCLDVRKQLKEIKINAILFKIIYQLLLFCVFFRLRNIFLKRKTLIKILEKRFLQPIETPRRSSILTIQLLQKAGLKRIMPNLMERDGNLIKFWMVIKNYNF